MTALYRQLYIASKGLAVPKFSLHVFAGVEAALHTKLLGSRLLRHNRNRLHEHSLQGRSCSRMACEDCRGKRFTGLDSRQYVQAYMV